MKIITDPDLISYRINLQQLLLGHRDDLGILMEDLKDKKKQGNALGENDVKMLQNKIEEIAYEFYELEYGNYFVKQSTAFKKKVIEETTKKFIGYLDDKSIDNLLGFVTMQIYPDLTEELNSQISQNGR